MKIKTYDWVSRDGALALGSQVAQAGTICIGCDYWNASAGSYLGSQTHRHRPVDVHQHAEAPGAFHLTCGCST